eukprot:TRINITY_DN20093_c0_g1_i1.p1 TRINITY_DN20093_c0_g1~~TRINITY_DN20093_c0_g1_i1.p1  ORF type:complete len:548 (+),score=181.44 TRINITY_DN20093_c0_g1_i1:70-1644(+)
MGGDVALVAPAAQVPRFQCRHQQERESAPLPTLGTGKLLGVLFVACIGGAYGSEGCLSSGGPLLTLIFIAVLPWAWGMPTALCVAELASAMPSNAGVDMWINCAFPVWFTCMSLCWTFLINRVDNSLYPNLFVDYLAQIVGLSAAWKAVIKVVFVLFCVVVNILGVELVGWASVAFSIASALPFLLMFLWETPHMDTTDWGYVPSTVDWKTFLPLIAWNVSGFDSAGHIVEEVKTTSKYTLVKAFAWLMVITQAIYMLPVMAGVSAQTRRGYGGSDSGSENGTREARTDYQDWDDGYWVPVAKWCGGEWQGYVMLVGGCMSALGFMASLFCTTSRALQGHAVLGLFPAPVCRWLKYMHPVYRTPVHAIVVNGVLCLGLSLILEFDTLVDVDQVLYSLRLMAIFAACVQLRRKYPQLSRPFRIPISDRALPFALAVPFLFCVACAIVGAFAEPKAFAIAVTLVGGSVVFGVFFSRYLRPEGFDGGIVLGDESQDPESFDGLLHTSAKDSKEVASPVAPQAVTPLY